MPDRQPAAFNPCALLWDESFLWGLMAWKALRQSDLPFDLVRAQDIRSGKLSSYRMLFVPGGWATAKVSALGNAGLAEIRRFVQNGGSYLGICGGAGLASDSHLGLLPVSRRSNTDRVPSFSGPIRLSPADHPIWKSVPTTVFQAWWPPQLDVAPEKDFQILARYGDALPQAMSADIRVADGRKADWTELEKRYGILLDPDRLKGEPAVVEGRCGRGKVILSLVHFDTPNDPHGAMVLKNLWRYLLGDARDSASRKPPHPADVSGVNDVFSFSNLLFEIDHTVNHLIAEGRRLHLWRRRNDLLLQWRRGIRGMEYSTLEALTKEITGRLWALRPDATGFCAWPDQAPLKNDLEGIRNRLAQFASESIDLLRLEYAHRTDPARSPASLQNENIQQLQGNLFGTARPFGGKFKPLIDAMDRLLYRLLQDRTS